MLTPPDKLNFNDHFLPARQDTAETVATNKALSKTLDLLQKQCGASGSMVTSFKDSPLEQLCFQEINDDGDVEVADFDVSSIVKELNIKLDKKIRGIIKNLRNLQTYLKTDTPQADKPAP